MEFKKIEDGNDEIKQENSYFQKSHLIILCMCIFAIYLTNYIAYMATDAKSTADLALSQSEENLTDIRSDIDELNQKVNDINGPFGQTSDFHSRINDLEWQKSRVELMELKIDRLESDVNFIKSNNLLNNRY